MCLLTIVVLDQEKHGATHCDILILVRFADGFVPAEEFFLVGFEFFEPFGEDGIGGGDRIQLFEERKPEMALAMRASRAIVLNIGASSRRVCSLTPVRNMPSC